MTGFVYGFFHLLIILLATMYDIVGLRWVVALIVVLVVTAVGVFYAWLRDCSGSAWVLAIGYIIVNFMFDLGFLVVVLTMLVSLVKVAGESGVVIFGVVLVMVGLLLVWVEVWWVLVVIVPIGVSLREVVAAR